MSNLSLWNNPSTKCSFVGSLFQMFSSYAAKALPDLVTEMMVQVGHRNASQEVLIAVSSRGYVPGETISNLKNYDELKSAIPNIPVAEATT